MRQEEEKKKKKRAARAGELAVLEGELRGTLEPLGGC
jgi:hypothetical protein